MLPLNGPHLGPFSDLPGDVSLVCVAAAIEETREGLSLHASLFTWVNPVFSAIASHSSPERPKLP